MSSTQYSPEPAQQCSSSPNLLRLSSYFLVAFLFLLALFIVIVDAVVVSEFAYNTPRPPVNFSGTRTITVNLTNSATDLGAMFNLTNVSFYAMVPGGSLILIGHNTTANLTQYTFGWNTNSGSFPDNLTYEIRVNASGFIASSGAAVQLNSNSGFNITVDNTPPAFSFFGSSSTANPDASNYINSTPQLVSFNFTVTDTLFTAMEGMCQVVVDFSNSTGGGNLTSTAGTYRNNTFFNLSATVGASLEGRHDYRVQCRQDPGTNLTGYSAARTLVIDTTKPVATIRFLNVFDVEQTEFGLHHHATVRCDRFDATSGFNRTEISIKAPTDTVAISKKIDTSSASHGTTKISTDFLIDQKDLGLLGDYLVSCAVDDMAGNRFTTNKTLKIVTQPPPSTSAYSVPGFKEPISKTIIGVGGMSNVGPLMSDGIARLMAETAIVIITIKGQPHTFTAKEIGDGYAKLDIASEPFEVRINEGETKEIDVDADGLNDITINLNMIYKNKADLIFNLLTAPTPTAPGTAPGEQGQQPVPPTPAKKGGFSFVTSLIILIIFLVLVFIALHFFRKKGGGSQETGGGGLKFTPKDLGMTRESGDQPFDSYGIRAPGQPQQPRSQQPNKPFY